MPRIATYTPTLGHVSLFGIAIGGGGGANDMGSNTSTSKQTRTVTYAARHCNEQPPSSLPSANLKYSAFDQSDTLQMDPICIGKRGGACCGDSVLNGEPDGMVHAFKERRRKRREQSVASIANASSHPRMERRELRTLTILGTGRVDIVVTRCQ
ncbi:hypothetical protein B0H21DRAFT_334602 [Amylocystis lapponica]|nr:hypothetical protein B0H21DRAFT_334602 [Amylocystis lapponica]